MTRATSVSDDCINKLKSRGSTKKNEPKREKKDTAESILVQKSGPALAVLPDRRRRPCYPQLEYAAPVWDPYVQEDIQRTKMVQRQAARWVLSDYSP